MNQFYLLCVYILFSSLYMLYTYNDGENPYHNYLANSSPDQSNIDHLVFEQKEKGLNTLHLSDNYEAIFQVFLRFLSKKELEEIKEQYANYRQYGVVLVDQVYRHYHFPILPLYCKSDLTLVIYIYKLFNVLWYVNSNPS